MLNYVNTDMPSLPVAHTVDERDALIRKYLTQALDYMNNNPTDGMKGPVAKMYAEWVLETFNNAQLSQEA
jgi:hypothetical protein